MPPPVARDAGIVATLLAQLGALATDRLAERVAELDLTPSTAGILRGVAAEPGLSQQSLSTQLRLLPSRVVAFVDDLQSRGLLERRRRDGDRRVHALFLTDAGRALTRRLGTATRAHEDEFTAGLTREQVSTLAALLGVIAERQGIVSPRSPR